MTMTTESQTTSAPAEPGRMPWLALAVFTLVGFTLISAETMPAGLLREIATGLNTTEGTVGLFVSAFALGTVIVTVPAIALTRRIRRKPLFLAGLAMFVVANTVTALSSEVVLSLISRFVAGALTGFLWGMFAVYAVRISPKERAGRALAIVSMGAPLGIALGTPLGAWIGAHLDWRWAFAGVTALAMCAFVLVGALVPDAPGQPSVRTSAVQVLRIPGVVPVLAVITVWMLSHSTMYTYVAPYLLDGGTDLPIDLTLLVFGISSVVGLLITGTLVDRHLRPVVLASIGFFTAAGATLLVVHGSPAAILAATVVWGITFGGAAPQLQTALNATSGAAVDVATAFLPVAFNLAIFGAGILGALILTLTNPIVLPATMIVLGVIAFVIAYARRRTALPLPGSSSRD